MDKTQPHPDPAQPRDETTEKFLTEKEGNKANKPADTKNQTDQSTNPEAPVEKVKPDHLDQHTGTDRDWQGSDPMAPVKPY